MAKCVKCGGEPFRRLGLIGPVCRPCTEAAFESGDYMAYFNDPNG